MGSTAPLVHIGYHKTATTFLQQELFADDRTFQAPWKPQSAEAIEHFVLTHPRRFDPGAIRDSFLATCRDDGRVPVISHEALSGNPVYGRYDSDRIAARIAACFPDACILIGVREQASLLHSLYLQYISQGGTEDIDAMLRQNADRIGFRPLLRMDFFEYDLMVEIYSQHFPMERILVQPIELLHADPDAYLSRLGGFLNIPLLAQGPLRRVNERQSELAMMLRRRLNHVIPTPVERPLRYADYPLPYRLRNRILRQLDRTLQRHFPSRHAASPIRDRIARFTGNRFAQSNGRLAAMTGLDLEGLRYPVVVPQ